MNCQILTEGCNRQNKRPPSGLYNAQSKKRRSLESQFSNSEFRHYDENKENQIQSNVQNSLVVNPIIKAKLNKTAISSSIDHAAQSQKVAAENEYPTVKEEIDLDATEKSSTYSNSAQQNLQQEFHFQPNATAPVQGNEAMATLKLYYETDPIQKDFEINEFEDPRIETPFTSNHYDNLNPHYKRLALHAKSAYLKYLKDPRVLHKNLYDENGNAKVDARPQSILLQHLLPFLNYDPSKRPNNLQETVDALKIKLNISDQSSAQPTLQCENPVEWQIGQKSITSPGKSTYNIGNILGQGSSFIAQSATVRGVKVAVKQPHKSIWMLCNYDNYDYAKELASDQVYPKLLRKGKSTIEEIYSPIPEKLTQKDIAIIMIQTAQQLIDAKDIVNLDIKIENIGVKLNEKGRVTDAVIFDWDTLHNVNDTAKRFIGSPGYCIAPEMIPQLIDGTSYLVNKSSDFFLWAATMYHLLILPNDTSLMSRLISKSNNKQIDPSSSSASSLPSSSRLYSASSSSSSSSSSCSISASSSSSSSEAHSALGTSRASTVASTSRSASSSEAHSALGTSHASTLASASSSASLSITKNSASALSTNPPSLSMPQIKTISNLDNKYLTTPPPLQRDSFDSYDSTSEVDVFWRDEFDPQLNLDILYSAITTYWKDPSHDDNAQLKKLQVWANSHDNRSIINAVKDNLHLYSKTLNRTTIAKRLKMLLE